MRLEWTVIRRLDGLLQGDYTTLFRGVGIDLVELREYQAEDDVRHIDWNVTARLQVPHMRVYNEDRELSAWFLLDLSASIGFGSAALTKEALSVQFVAVLARLLTRHGNRVGAQVRYGGLDPSQPATDRNPGNLRRRHCRGKAGAHDRQAVVGLPAQLGDQLGNGLH